MDTTNVVLRNGWGEPTVYSDISTITLPGEDGQPKIFSLGVLPTLNAPTNISDIQTANIINTNDKGNYITVTNPITNGNFATTCQLLADIPEDPNNDESPLIETIVAEAKVNNTGNVTFYAEDWTIPYLYQTAQLKARFSANSFKPSDIYEGEERWHYTNKASIAQTQFGGNYGLTEMSYDCTNLTLTNQSSSIYWGQLLSMQIQPTTGYYYPKTINIESEKFFLKTFKDWHKSPQWTYDNQTGLITIPYNRIDPLTDTGTIPDDYCGYAEKIIITANAPDKPWLKDFVTDILLTDTILTVPKPDDNAQRIEIKENNNLIYSQRYNAQQTIINVKDGFYLDQEGYYQPNNQTGTNNSVLWRIQFDCIEPTTVIIEYVNNGFGGYNFGMISKLNTTLYASPSSNSRDKCQYYGANDHSTAIRSLQVELPAGESTIDFKYVRGSNHAYDNDFRFKIILPAATIDLSTIPELQEPNTYELSITAEAEGYTGTDPVPITYIKTATTVEDTTLIINNANVENKIITINQATVENKILTL